MIVQNIKIVFPKYKMIMSMFFIIFIALIHDVDAECDIGSFVDRYMSLLMMVCSLDIMFSELYGDLKDIFAKYGCSVNIGLVFKRIFLQWIIMMIISSIFYMLFLIKQGGVTAESGKYFVYAQFATGCSMLFWGIITLFVNYLMNNRFVGLIISIVLWNLLISTIGEKIKPEFNVMSYIFANDPIQNMQWMFGKLGACLLAFFSAIGIIYLLRNPKNNVKKYV